MATQNKKITVMYNDTNFFIIQKNNQIISFDDSDNQIKMDIADYILKFRDSLLLAENLDTMDDVLDFYNSKQYIEKFNKIKNHSFIKNNKDGNI